MDFGYARASFWRAAPTPDAQGAAVAAYAARRGWDFDSERQLFLDGAATRVLDLRDRAAGEAMFTRLRRGDRVITVSLDRTFHRVDDAAATLDLWSALGVELHVVALGGPVEVLTPLVMAGAMADLESAARSERAALSAMKSRYYKRPVNGTSPIGFRWERQPDSREWRLVRDVEQRAVMGALLRWVDLGFSLDQIRCHLRYNLKPHFPRFEDHQATSLITPFSR
jgi:DNA invertase Pin-like site-specific DNA recombinase